MPLQIPLPNVDTGVVFTDHDGNPIFTADLIQLDTLVIEARQGVNLTTKDGRYKWITNVATALSSLIQRSVSPAIAAFVIQRVHSEMADLKKIFASTPTLPNSTESTLQDSIQSYDGASPETSPDSPLSENFENELPAETSQQIEPTISSPTRPAPKTKRRKRTPA